jgi:hypothetical protein
MRKLAPIFALTSIVALAGGTALANTDKMTQGTASSTNVTATTTGTPEVSYSEKMNASTTATADDKAVAKKKAKKKIVRNDSAKSPVPATNAATAGSVDGKASGS